MFLTLSKAEIIMLVTSNLSSANTFNLVQSKILSLGKEFKTLYKLQPEELSLNVTYAPRQHFDGNRQFNPFPNDKFQTLPNSNSLQTTILNLIEMVKSSLKG